jgi:hypothetical protein
MLLEKTQDGNTPQLRPLVRRERTPIEKIYDALDRPPQTEEEFIPCVLTSRKFLYWCVQAIHSLQTFREQAVGESLERDGIGLGKFHARRFGPIVKQLQAGLQITALDDLYCRDAIIRYRKQLLQYLRDALADSGMEANTWWETIR